MTADGYTSNPPSGGGGEGGPVAWADITGKPTTFTPAAHTQAASTISDSTAVGRAVLTATDAAAGRSAIGAGTSSLALGATGSTAAAGNHSHGGGGSSLVIKRATITSGNVTPQASVPWAALTGGPSLAIAAAVGDYVEFAIVSGMWDPAASFLDWAVMVAGSPVRYLSTGTATPAIEGAPSFYADPQTYHNYGPVFEFQVEAGDLSGGNVTIGFMTRGDGGGTLFASTNYPLRWRAMNHGAVSVS